MLSELIKKNRSYRRFYEEEAISIESLKQLVNLGRLSPSAMNQQPLKYMLVNDKEKMKKFFPV